MNNAGIVGGIGAVEFVDMENARQAFDVNYFGTLAMTQAFLPMIRKSEARIINMSR